MRSRFFGGKGTGGLLVSWALLGMLLFCSSCQPHDKAVVRIRAKTYTRSVAELAQARLTPTLVDPDYLLVLDMAMLSANVYSGVQSRDHRPDYGQDTAKYAGERRELARRGWRPFAFRYAVGAPAGERLASGLVFDVWVRTAPGTPPLAVLVFRGTNYLEFADWVANVRPLTNTPGVWDQYEQARVLTPVLVAKLDSAYGGRQRVMAAGHSLGGGLAQHAGFTCGRVEKVFAFNSSPLTGYFDLAKRERLRHGSGRRTYLVYESYEVLAMLRLLPGVLDRFTDNANAVVVRYNFSEVGTWSPFRQHEMQRLVAGLGKK